MLRALELAACLPWSCPQLLRPRDPGLKAFWVDFNTGSASTSLFVEEPSSTDHTPSEGLWETVVIKETCVKKWELTG